MQKKRFEIHVEQEMYDDIRIIALETGKSLSDVLRDFAKANIESHKKKPKKFTELRKVLLT